MFTIRPFTETDADYTLMTTIYAAALPEQARTAAEWRHNDELLDPHYPYQRDLIEWNGQVIAYGEYGQHSEHYHPQKYFFYFFADSNTEHPAVRKFYFDHVLATLAEHNPIAITSGTLENKPLSIAFLIEQGFQEIMRESISRLDLVTFDPAQFAGIPEQVRADGIQISSVTELMEYDPDYQSKLYELEWKLIQDVPNTEPPQKLPLEEFVKRIFEDPNFIPEAYLVALDSDRYIGQTTLRHMQADNECYWTGLTGVTRSHRRRGIALALKLRNIDYARQQGAWFIETANEENNPMLQINLRLGFQPQPAWIEFEKSL